MFLHRLTFYKKWPVYGLNFGNMKHLLIVLLILLGFSGFGQNRFPSVDSAKNYVLRYIKNSAVESFTNWRMQNVTYGTLELLDSIAVDGALDSIYKSGDTLKYSLGGVVYTVGTFGGITTASNGLTATSGNVKLGGSLIQGTTIDVTAGNDLTFAFGNGDIIFENDGSDVENLNFIGNGGNTTLNGGSLSFSSGANILSLRLSDAFTGTKTYKFPSKPTTAANFYLPLTVNGSAGNDTGNIVLNVDTATVVKAYVTNAESVTITKGQVVYIFGASGDRASVKLAKNTSDTFSSKTLGIVRADIAAGQAGWVTTQGQISGINLGAYTAGDILWLDSVAGGFSKTKPVAPKHSVFVGVVERANAGNGLIYVKPQNGVELDEIHNVLITSPTNNQVLSYTASTGIWENKSVTTALGYTPVKINIRDTIASQKWWVKDRLPITTARRWALVVDTSTNRIERQNLNIFRRDQDTVPLAVFNVGSAAAGDTAAFSTSTLAGSFYLDGTDTMFVTSYRVALQGTSASITPEVWFNDSLNVTAGGTRLATGSAITNLTTGTSVTPTTNKIPPANFVFVRFSAVTTKPTYFTLTLFGYRIRKQ